VAAGRRSVRDGGETPRGRSLVTAAVRYVGMKPFRLVSALSSSFAQSVWQGELGLSALWMMLVLRCDLILGQLSGISSQGASAGL